MTSSELRWKIIKFFNDQAQVYIVSPRRIEVDVSKEISTSEWKRCAMELGFTDNTKNIPDSYKYNDITVIFFYGPLQKFNQRNKTNWSISRQPNSQPNMDEITVQ